ncbi:MAG TPA: LysM peptidoglycan-binding domain-containing protein [Candidatus Competibacteraceae bacterium]|nr:LysM peptidoglycan-binding domain-containing protein [Candidatus Competibacteraceae bacterium]
MPLAFSKQLWTVEKAVLMADNVRGMKAVSAAGMTAPPQTGKVEYYEIQTGDTLSAIVRQFLGQAAAHPKIFEAHREVIKDPDLIYSGQKIRIPVS